MKRKRPIPVDPGPNADRETHRIWAAAVLNAHADELERRKLAEKKLAAANESATAARLFAYAREARRQNIMKAVELAQRAVGGFGPPALLDALSCIGRDYGGTIMAPAKARQGLRVIEGGAS